MKKRNVNMLTGLIGFVGLATFILGLSYSISTGFAGFTGGLPFMIIAIFVLLLAVYDFWDDCIRKKR